jgi:secondary thiamine-phosphate synthase enzyme
VGAECGRRAEAVGTFRAKTHGTKENGGHEENDAFENARIASGGQRVKVATEYLWFNTSQRQEFVRITDQVAAVVEKSGVTEGLALVSAMHITSGVYVNDWEDGLIHDFQVWLEKLAPSGLDYRHHQTGEDNADAHLKRTIMGHQVMLPITGGKLDLGPWEQVFYAEFDGRRRKRVVVKVMGE